MKGQATHLGEGGIYGLLYPTPTHAHARTHTPLFLWPVFRWSDEMDQGCLKPN